MTFGRNIGRKQTYTKTETCKFYSRVFWTLQPNVIKIDHYNFELYCFNVAAFIQKQCRSFILQSITGPQGVAYRCVILLILSLNVSKEVVTKKAKNDRRRQPYCA